MSDSVVFREKIEPQPEIVGTMEPVALDPGVSSAEMPTRPYDTWETDLGKYAIELFGVKETHQEFPLRMQLGSLHKYITAELETRQWEPNKKNFQTILTEIENEIGTVRLETFTRLKKIYDYIQVKNKYNAIKSKLDAYRVMS